MPVRVGVAGWSYKDWEGIAYPKPAPKGFDPLQYLSEYIDLIEINSTFYRPCKREVASGWARRAETNPDFRFTLKISRTLTHDPGPPSAEDVREARVGPETLMEAGRLGAVLVQFPWSFKNDESSRKRLFALFEALAGLPLALEVRHQSWDQKPVYEALAERGVAFVNIDQPVIGRALGPTEKITAPLAYVRLHGRNYGDWLNPDAGRNDRYNYLYTERELEPWAERIERLAESSDEVYVVANNHFKAKALVNSIQLRRRLGQRAKVPKPLFEAYPLLQEDQREGR